MKTHHNFEHANVSEALPSILGVLLADGEEVGSRQGERTLEILMPRIVLTKPWQREVLVPGRKASIAAQIAETMWVLAGRNDVEWLSHYLPRAAEFSDDGEVWRGGYGPRIRRWRWGPAASIDQLSEVVDLLNNERGTRRAVINIYDPITDSGRGGKDIPCNNWLSFISRGGKLHMNVATRSNDVIWGWSGINQFEWSALQEIVASLTGNQMGTLTFNIPSLHVYEKHWDKARRIVSEFNGVNTMVMTDSPLFKPEFRTVEHLDNLIAGWFEIEDKISNGNPCQDQVDDFPEPMLQSWLRVIQWYWSVGLPKDPEIAPLIGSRLHQAVVMSPSRAGVPRRPDAMTSTRDVEKPLAWMSEFVQFVDTLHREKSAVYGNSWNKRGEQMSIMANIARKVDRLGVAGAGDSSADTVIDLLVYLMKYRVWLSTEKGAPTPNYALYYPPGLHENDAVLEILSNLDREVDRQRLTLPATGNHVAAIKGAFDNLQTIVEADPHTKHPSRRLLTVQMMSRLAFPLARHFWYKENPGFLPASHFNEAFDNATLPPSDAEIAEEIKTKDAFEQANATRRWAGYENPGENID